MEATLRNIVLLTVVSGVIVIDGFLGISLVANWIDYPIDYLNINPQIQFSPPKPFSQFILYQYPQDYSSASSGVSTYANESISFGIDLVIIIGYSYNDSLTTHSNFFYTAGGCIYPKGQQIIQSVSIKYQNSVASTDYSLITPEFPLDLIALTGNDGIVIPTPNALPNYGKLVKWNVEGDYYPVIDIVFKNGSEVQNVVSNGKIHIYQYDQTKDEHYLLQQAHDSNRDRQMAFAGIVLPILSISTIIGLFKNKKKKEDSKTDKIQPKPDKTDNEEKGDKGKRNNSKKRVPAKSKRERIDYYTEN